MTLKNNRLGHVLGIGSLIILAALVFDTYLRNTPAPHISGTIFVLLYFVSFFLSVSAAYLASKLWFIESACLGLLMVLVWIGEYLFESKL